METEFSAAGNSNLGRNHLEDDQQATAAYANAIHTTNNSIPRNDGNRDEAIKQMSLYCTFIFTAI